MKKKVMEVNAGKRGRRKSVWGEAGSADTGKERRKFFHEPGEGSLEPGQGSVRKLKQKLIISLTQNEILARQILIKLRGRRSGMWTWRTKLTVITF